MYLQCFHKVYWSSFQVPSNVSKYMYLFLFAKLMKDIEQVLMVPWDGRICLVLLRIV